MKTEIVFKKMFNDCKYICNNSHKLGEYKL